jgi:hypothetical protein
VAAQLAASQEGLSSVIKQVSSINTIKKNTNSNVRKNIGLEADTEKTKCVLKSRHQNAGQILDMDSGNRNFEHVAKLGRRVTNKKLIRDRVKSRLEIKFLCNRSWVEAHRVVRC